VEIVPWNGLHPADVHDALRTALAVHSLLLRTHVVLGNHTHASYLTVEVEFLCNLNVIKVLVLLRVFGLLQSAHQTAIGGVVLVFDLFIFANVF